MRPILPASIGQVSLATHAITFEIDPVRLLVYPHHSKAVPASSSSHSAMYVCSVGTWPEGGAEGLR